MARPSQAKREFALRYIGGIFRKDSSKVLCVEHDYSPVSNIGDIWGLEEGADESSIILDTDEVGFDALLQDFV